MSSLVMLMLLVQGPHFENPGLIVISPLTGETYATRWHQNTSHEVAIGALLICVC